MDIAQLIEIALANSDERRLELAALEPAAVKMGAVGSLTQLVAELVDNAISFSEPDDLVRVTGLHDQGDYLISISDRGVGIPQHLLSELNRVLAGGHHDSKSPLGISLVARLAARHDIEVRLVPGAPGTTARVTIPARLLEKPDTNEQVEEPEPRTEPETVAGRRLPPRGPQDEDIFARAEEVDETIDLTRFERSRRTHSGVIAMSEEARRRAEMFLDKVFAPLVERPGVAERPAPRPRNEENGTRRPREEKPSVPRQHPLSDEEHARAERSGTVTTLRVRVPGENFSPVDDDVSTTAAEAAIDIRSALSRYAEGRRSAEETGGHPDDGTTRR